MPARDIIPSTRQAFERWREAALAERFDRDPFLGRLLRRCLGPAADALAGELRALAAVTGAPFDELVSESNRDENLPALRRHDRDGRRIEEVVFHPAYHEVGRVFWASRVVAGLAEPGAEVACGARAYLLAQHGEAGHACPVACTAGAVKLVQRLGTDDQRRRYLGPLLEPDYDRRLHAAQFVTEIQGGSDVGRNAVVATPDPARPGWYRLSGEKWFCSVADAGLFVISARLPDAPAGTRGLGLFLVPRRLEGRPNGFALRRLKAKLGTRSMPTGEIELEGALGEPVGALDQGFRNLVSIVLDTSRVHNALAACGLMRRACLEAWHFAAQREAFDRPILGFPAVASTLARMRLSSQAALATTFRVLAMTDGLDTGVADPGLVAARRISVMLNKYWTALAATRSARDGIEVLGGNGAIEDFSPLPRLYRDAIVVESWEGTHNTLCAQIVRDLATRDLARPWLARLASELAEVDQPALAAVADTGRALLEDAERRIQRLLAADPETAAAWMRPVADRMARLTDWVALAGQAQWTLAYTGNTDLLDSLALYRALWLEPIDPQDDPDRVALERRLALAP